MNILFIAHRIPYPPNKGEKIRSFNEIKYLSKIHNIYLACLADNFDDLKYKDDLKKYCKDVKVVSINPVLSKFKASFNLLTNKPLSISYFYSKKLRKIIDQLLLRNEFGVIICFSSPMAEYVFRSSVFSRRSINHGNDSLVDNHGSGTSKPSAKLIMDFVDVDSDKWFQYSKYSKFSYSWVFYLESKRLAKYEQKIAELFDYSIFVSAKEADFFQRKNPHVKNIISIPNGVDLDYFNPELVDDLRSRVTCNKSCQKSSNGNSPSTLVFIGNMDYFANIDGVKWFVKEVFPLVKEHLSDTKFYIVGNNPAKEVIALGKNKDIIVTGSVPDTREYLINASVFIAPLRIARGIQNKILEAMAMGIPVVATPQSFEGIESEPNKDLFVESIPREFADKIVRLLIDGNIRESFKRNSLKVIEEKYSWDRNIEFLNEIIKKS